MFNRPMIEVVKTGNEFTSFVLLPYECEPRKVVSSMFETPAELIALSIFPDANLVSAEEFAAEIEERIKWTLV